MINKYASTVFWSKVKARFAELEVPLDEYDKLLDFIELHVNPPKKSIRPQESCQDKKKTRKDGDYYPTPSAATQVLIDNVDIKGTVFEPCAGKTRAIANLFPDCVTNDIDQNPDFQDSWDFNLNAGSSNAWKKFGIYDWIVTNPPFDHAPDIIPLAWEHCRVGIAFLLRLSYLEPCQNRSGWLKEHEPHLSDLLFLNPRIRFRDDTRGTDSVTTAWMVWRKDNGDCAPRTGRANRYCRAQFVSDYHLPS